MIAQGVPLGDVTDHLVGVFRDPAILLGIPLALLGAVFMSVSTVIVAINAQLLAREPVKARD